MSFIKGKILLNFKINETLFVITTLKSVGTTRLKTLNLLNTFEFQARQVFLGKFKVSLDSEITNISFGRFTVIPKRVEAMLHSNSSLPF